jgi:protein TonB
MATRSDLHPVAFCISLGIHVGLLFLIPYRQEVAVPPPMRMMVEFSQPAPQTEATTEPQPEVTEPAPEPVPEPVPPKPKPKPKKVEQAPILAAKQSPDAPVVPDTSEVPAVTETPVAEAPEIESVEPVESAVANPAQQQTSQPPSDVAMVTSTAEPQEASEDEAWQGYGQLLYDMVEKGKKYPPIAIRRHLEGRVTISARISMGKLVDVTLIDSSGHKVLDEQALEMVRKAASTLPVKNGLAQKSFTVLVPIDFKLQG